jgi:hypothetical protein
MVKPRTLDIDDLMKQVTPEERVYRNRCVEPGPWRSHGPASAVSTLEDRWLAGFRKYVVFETAQDTVMDGSNAPYPWPYVEGVTVDEAANHLAFISRGLYGRLLPPQNGANPADVAVEMRLQIRESADHDQLRRKTALDLLGGGPSKYGFGQTSTRRPASAPEPSVGAASGEWRKSAHTQF